jgi:hypothetical protein
MKRTSSLSLLLLALTVTLAFSAVSAATPDPSPHQRHRRFPFDGPATPSTGNPLNTAAGTITAIESVLCEPGQPCVQILVETGNSVLRVHLGPEAYLREQGVEFAVGDPIEASGMPGGSYGEPILLAASLKLGERTITLRDDFGWPQWMPAPTSGYRGYGWGYGCGGDYGCGYWHHRGHHGCYGYGCW